MKIVVHDLNNHRHQLDAIEGWTAMEIIREHGLGIKAECNGAAACGTCHVRVAAQWLQQLYPPREDECERLAELLQRHDDSRLSCQIVLDASHAGLELSLTTDCEITG